MEKLIVRAIWKDTGHPVKAYGRVVRGELVDEKEMTNSRIRRLTPTECERLQGFPDGWTEGISDSQRYKCLGNAVTVNVIQAIMEKVNEETR